MLRSPDAFPGSGVTRLQQTLRLLRQESQSTLTRIEEAGLLDVPDVAMLADDLVSALHCLELLADGSRFSPSASVPATGSVCDGDAAQGRQLSAATPARPLSDPDPAALPARRALREPLTSTVIPDLCVDRLEQALLRQSRNREGIAVLAIAFRPPPDERDAAIAPILKEVGRRILLHVRETDTASYFGAGRFIVLVSALRSIVDANRVAERLLAAVPGVLETPERSVRLTACAGVAFSRFCGGQATPEGMLNEAWTALALARRQGAGPLHIVAPHEHLGAAGSPSATDAS